MIAGETAISEVGGHIGVMQRIINEDIPPLAKRASWVSEKLAAVIDAGLVRDRNKRVADAATFVGMLLDAFPDAGSRPSIGHLPRATDISELAPGSEPAPSTTSDPSVRAASVAQAGPARVPATPEQPVKPAPAAASSKSKLVDTGNPPSSGGPPSSADDSVAIFMREESLPRELLELRAKAKKNKG